MIRVTLTFDGVSAQVGFTSHKQAAQVAAAFAHCHGKDRNNPSSFTFDSIVRRITWTNQLRTAHVTVEEI